MSVKIYVLRVKLILEEKNKGGVEVIVLGGWGRVIMWYINICNVK